MKLSIQLTVITLLIFFFYGCENSQKTATNQVAQYKEFVSEMRSKGFPTGNILIYEEGKVIFQSATGLRSIDPMDSLSLDSQFRLASVSKQFTGMAIMKLKEAGKLDYDQKVNSILTDFPYDSITVRQLLHHTSGLADYMEIVETNFIPKDSTQQYLLGNDDVLELFYKANPDLIFQPGDNWEYSNTGYLVLASIVEEISNQHLSSFFKEHIFDPLGMENTSLFDYQIEADPNMPHRVFGYRKALDQKELLLNDYHFLNDVRGDGGVYSTLNDLYTWNLALANYEIIPKKYLDEAWTSGTLNNGEKTYYGFGWFLPRDSLSTQRVSHSGGWVGFGTYLHNNIDTKSGYVVLTNNSFASFGPILAAIDSIQQGAPYVIQKESLSNAVAKQIFGTNLNEAIEYYHEIKHDSTNYAVGESQLNNLGYALLNNGHQEEALTIFKLNIAEYPVSANTYDSYGDALMAKGDSLKALENYKIAYRRDSTLTYSKNKMIALEEALKK